MGHGGGTPDQPEAWVIWRVKEPSTYRSAYQRRTITSYYIVGGVLASLV